MLLLYFGNLAALSAILSSFTARFLFPLLSLEGRAFWVVGLAPIPREALVRQKAIAGAWVILPIGVAAALASGYFLGFRGWLLAGAVYDVLLIGICLVSLAAGLGAAYPNRNEDNPAKIAVGLGGTLNFFISVMSIALIVAVELIPYYPYVRRWGAMPSDLDVAGAHVGALVLAGGISWLSIRAGRRAIRSMEF
jgi:ABC-2 type transport system permease protein